MIDPEQIEEWWQDAYLHRGTEDVEGSTVPAEYADRVWALLAEREEMIDDEKISRAVLAAARSWKAAALSLLREVEWVGKGEVNPRHCPVCLGLKPGDSRSLFGIDDERDGHAPDCRLAAMLKG